LILWRSARRENEQGLGELTQATAEGASCLDEALITKIFGASAAMRCAGSSCENRRTPIMQNLESYDGKSALYLFGGLALVVLGTGLIVSHPTIQKYLGQVGLNDLMQAAIPDVERYLKLRSM